MMQSSLRGELTLPKLRERPPDSPQAWPEEGAISPEMLPAMMCMAAATKDISRIEELIEMVIILVITVVCI